MSSQALYDGLYNDQNVAVSGIHTHSGPGGYLQYVLYDITSLGFVQQSYDALVYGILTVRSCQPIYPSCHNQDAQAVQQIKHEKKLDFKNHVPITVLLQNPPFANRLLPAEALKVDQ